jgi:ATP-dependent Clp protease, protease subunit
MPGTRPEEWSDFVFGRVLRERTIVLGAEVDDEIAARVVAQLVLLNAEDPREDIGLYLDSPGGSLSAGLAIYDAMRFVAADVSTWAVGFVAAIAQFLLCSGTPGKRYALPAARIVMRHPSHREAGRDITRRTEVYHDWYDEIAREMCRRTGRPFALIARDLERGRSFSAAESYSYGIVDRVVRGAPGAPQHN